MEFNSLEELIADIESGNNNFAMRFEPTVYMRMNQPGFANAVDNARIIHKCTRETAKVICATSWGRFQIMGFNLYADTKFCAVSVGALMASKVINGPDTQDDFFKAFCTQRGIYYSLDELRSNQKSRETFARIYNGSVLYADNIEQRLRPLVA